MQYHLPKKVLTLAKRSTIHIPHPRRQKKQKNVEKQPDGASLSRSGSKGLLGLEKTDTGARTIGKMTLRGITDDLPQSWWFASTAVPLLAATIGPLANVLSIAAIVTSWRAQLANDGELPEGADSKGEGIPDPHWELIMNGISLACGFIGNFFLLLNFTKRIRYIVALPMSIVLWFLATGILIGIITAIHIYDGPVGPGQTYSQGFWYAIIACVLYMLGAVILMVNMLGYFLGHYPQHFDLDDSQRTLILQTMMFFFWLAGGAGIFSQICDWSYADALYFCDVTVLTVGFGDFTPPNDAGRGFVFPYTVIGIIFLGLMINSLRKFAATMSRDKVIKAHALHERERTFGRTVTNENELRDRLGLPPRRSSDARRLSEGRKASVAESSTRRQRIDSLNQYGHFKVEGRAVTFHEYKAPVTGGGRGGAGRIATPKKALSRDEKLRARANSGGAKARRADRRQKLLLLKEEKDRFDAMREIQKNTRRFQQYFALSMSVLAFSVLWCVGALVFMYAERREQNLSYFQALYFCYVSLLTIGYGDFSPKSNAGKPFFVVWSLIAVPTMTILVSDMGDTVVTAINRATFTLADWTVMPREGAWHDFLGDHPKIKAYLEKKHSEIEKKKRMKLGFGIANPDIDIEGDAAADILFGRPQPPTLEQLADKDSLSDHELARKLALTIKRTAQDLHVDPPKKYNYEEWVEFTRLIRFSVKSRDEIEIEEEEEGCVEWDWIGENSPMLADSTESEWLLDRLCESLNRYTRKQAREARNNSNSLDLRKRNSKTRSSSEKYHFNAPDPQEEEESSTASASGSSTAKDTEKSPTSEKHEQHKHQHEHWHGLGHVQGRDYEHSRDGDIESKAVREWEERIARGREDAKKALDKQEEREKEGEKEKEKG